MSLTTVFSSYVEKLQQLDTGFMREDVPHNIAALTNRQRKMLVQADITTALRSSEKINLQKAPPNPMGYGISQTEYETRALRDIAAGIPVAQKDRIIQSALDYINVINSKVKDVNDPDFKNFNFPRAVADNSINLFLSELTK